MRQNSKIRAAIIFSGRLGLLPERNDESTQISVERIGGLTVIERIFLASQKAGVEKFVVVGLSEEEVDHVSKKYREHIPHGPAVGRFDNSPGLELQFLGNDSDLHANSQSFQAIAEIMKGESAFFSITGGCVFEPDAIRDMGNATLLLDRFMAVAAIKTNNTDDAIDDCLMKAEVDGERVLSLGEFKNSLLSCPGLFLCNVRLIDSIEPGTNSTMFQVINKICEADQMSFHNVGDTFLENVDTKRGLEIAEGKLYRNLVKETDGFLARHINRKISVFLTKFIANTELTPNRITFMNLGIGLMGAFFFAMGGYWASIAGALIFQLSSITDGCDGEIARLKFMESRFGGWLDIFCDNLTHIAVFGGIAYGAYGSQPASYLIWCGFLAVTGTMMSFLIVTLQLYRKESDDGPFFTSVSEEREHSGGSVTDIQDSLARRDFTYLLILFAVLECLPFFLVLTVIGSNVFWILLVLSRFRSCRE